MEIRETIQGMDVTVTVVNPSDLAKAAGLLEALAAMADSHSNGSVPRSGNVMNAHQPIPSGPTARARLASQPMSNEMQSKLRRALLRIQGNPAAKILSALLKHPSGCIDSKLKEECGVEKEANWGPHFAHISKAASKADITPDLIVVKRSKRLGKGRFVHQYRLTDEAATLIREIPNFETERGFAEDDHEVLFDE